MYKYSEWLKIVTIIIDSREKEIAHITNYFDNQNVKYKVKKLESGDYTYSMSKCIVERKNSLDEISQNFTKNRERFKNEWERVPAGFIKYLIIEDNSFDDVFNNNYQSKINVNAFIASFLSFQIKYDIKLYFISKKNFPTLLLRLFYYDYYYSL